jgi:hypothetical protein
MGKEWARNGQGMGKEWARNGQGMGSEPGSERVKERKSEFQESFSEQPLFTVHSHIVHVPIKIPNVKFKVEEAGATGHVFIWVEHQRRIDIARASSDRHQRQHECAHGEHPHPDLFH